MPALRLLTTCADDAAQAVVSLGDVAIELVARVVALLLEAPWYESGWLIRLVALAVMFELSFCEFALRRTRARVSRGGRSSIFVSRPAPVDSCHCLLGPFLRGPQYYMDGRCGGGRGCPALPWLAFLVVLQVGLCLVVDPKLYALLEFIRDITVSYSEESKSPCFSGAKHGAPGASPHLPIRPFGSPATFWPTSPVSFG